ncbi:MAG: efflux RND transporter periplasmic adaptor subunit [Pseudomonadota bacterium]
MTLRRARKPKTRRPTSNRWIVATAALLVLLAAGFVRLHFFGDQPSAQAVAAVQALPEVVVSNPLQQQIDKRLTFLGQFSAVDRVELRAQVGGTLTGIYFKDGAIVHKGDLLFTIDPRPYEIKLAQAQAQLESANAQLVLAGQELARAQSLATRSFGTVENVDQRTSDRSGAVAAVDAAKAAIRDAQFDLDHCRIIAPFTGRIGTHLVSIGNLIAGSRAATSPTTLLATLVSLDPIHLDFDMSESDYETFSHYRAEAGGSLGNRIEFALNDDDHFSREGVLDFVDNELDRSSGTIHARATIQDPKFELTPGAFARVRLAASAPRPALMVPDAAVMPDQSSYFVLTVSAEGTVVPKIVQAGELRGGLRVISSGLSPDAKVIIDGLLYAAPGSKVSSKNGTIRYSSSSDVD